MMNLTSVALLKALNDQYTVLHEQNTKLLTINWITVGLTCALAMEAFLKMVAEGLLAYFSNGTCQIEFISLCVRYMPCNG